MQSRRAGTPLLVAHSACRVEIAHRTCEGEAGASRVRVPKQELGNEAKEADESFGLGEFFGAHPKKLHVLLRRSALSA